MRSIAELASIHFMPSIGSISSMSIDKCLACAFRMGWYGAGWLKWAGWMVEDGIGHCSSVGMHKAVLPSNRSHPRDIHPPRHYVYRVERILTFAHSLASLARRPPGRPLLSQIRPIERRHPYHHPRPSPCLYRIRALFPPTGRSIHRLFHSLFLLQDPRHARRRPTSRTRLLLPRIRRLS